MPKKDYSHLPPALRPKSKKVKEKQRAQRQRVRSDARQAAARKKSKAEDKWGNVKQAVQDVRSSDAVALGAMVLGRGRGKGGGVKLPKTMKEAGLGQVKAPSHQAARKAAAKNTRSAKQDVVVAKTMRKASTKSDYASRLTRTATRQAKAKTHEARKSSSASRKHAKAGRETPAEVYKSTAASATRLAETYKTKGVHRQSREARARTKSSHRERSGRQVIDANKNLKKAEATERKVNRLADLSAHIAKRAGAKPRPKAKQGKR